MLMTGLHARSQIRTQRASAAGGRPADLVPQPHHADVCGRAADLSHPGGQCRQWHVLHPHSMTGGLARTGLKGYFGPMSRQNLDLVKGVYREWEAGNFRAGRELLDESITTVWAEEFPTAGTYRGPAEHVRAMREWLGAWDEFELRAEEFIDAGDSVVVPFSVRARGKGSGANVERRWAHVLTLQNGRVVRFEVHLDVARALEAVGHGHPRSDGG